MRLMPIFSLAVTCIMSQGVLANEPENPGMPVQCAMSRASMAQKFVTINGKVYNEKSVTLTDLKIPELGVSQRTLVLSDNGVTLDGQIYGAELNGFFFDVRTVDEAASGPVTLKRVRIIRETHEEGQVRFYDCELNIPK